MRLLEEIRLKNPNMQVFEICEKIAIKSGKSKYTIRSYLNGTRRIKPSDCLLMSQILSEYLKRRVNNSEIRPDVFH